MLVDSNILIYAAQPAYAHLRQFIAAHAPAVSAVSYVEVLGYPQLDDEERQYLEAFFRLARVLPLLPTVLDQAVVLRQQRKMSLGDALVAGTALVYELTLVDHFVSLYQVIAALRASDTIVKLRVLGHRTGLSTCKGLTKRCTRTLTNCLDSGPTRVDKLGHLCSDRWKRTVPLPL